MFWREEMAGDSPRDSTPEMEICRADFCCEVALALAGSVASLLMMAFLGATFSLESWAELAVNEDDGADDFLDLPEMNVRSR